MIQTLIFFESGKVDHSVQTCPEMPLFPEKRPDQSFGAVIVRGWSAIKLKTRYFVRNVETSDIHTILENLTF
jgi:hypothetical protein